MKLLTVKAVADLLSCHESWVWKLTKDDPTFPRPISIGLGGKNQRGTRWVETDVAAWVVSRPVITEFPTDTDTDDNPDPNRPEA